MPRNTGMVSSEKGLRPIVQTTTFALVFEHEKSFGK